MAGGVCRGRCALVSTCVLVFTVQLYIYQDLEVALTRVISSYTSHHLHTDLDQDTDDMRLLLLLSKHRATWQDGRSKTSTPARSPNSLSTSKSSTTDTSISLPATFTRTTSTRATSTRATSTSSTSTTATSISATSTSATSTTATSTSATSTTATSTSATSTSPTPTTATSTRASVKVILLWNSFHSMSAFHFGVGRDPFRRFSCAWSRCETTEERRRLAEASAVVVHAPTLTGTRDLPPVRSPAQRWVFFALESPLWRRGVKFSAYDGLFNWTVTYRRDSDVPRYHGHIYVRPPYRSPESWRRKSRSILWVSTECGGAGRGLAGAYAAFIRQHYPVEEVSYRPGRARCPGHNTTTCHDITCVHEIMAQHRYYLALESAICRDYVTAPFFKAVSAGAVPIVLYARNYVGFIPRGALVDVRDYGKSREMALHLRNIDESEELQERYLSWRLERGRERYTNEFCSLCAKLWNSGERTGSYQSLGRWWAGAEVCPQAYNTVHWQE